MKVSYSLGDNLSKLDLEMNGFGEWILLLFIEESISYSNSFMDYSKFSF